MNTATEPTGKRVAAHYLGERIYTHGRGEGEWLETRNYYSPPARTLRKWFTKYPNFGSKVEGVKP